MATLTDYFQAEARGQLATLATALQSDAPDAIAVQRAARALRGTAQMARSERVHRSAAALEHAAREVVGGKLHWTGPLLAQARAAVSDLRALVEGTEGDAALDARAQRSLQGWRDAGLELPRSNADTRQHPTADAFRAYVAEEAEGIAALLAQGVASLAAEPMNRDPLKAILHRQRALLGSARLVEVPVVAEILNAVEDLSRVIARLDVGVKREWLDVYRIALDGLRASIEALRRDQDPPPSIALSRLRHIRTELLERYGSAPAANPAGANPDGFAPPRSELAEPPPAVDRAADAQSVGAVAPVSNPEPVPIAELEYRGTAALRRAAELRERLAPVLAREPALAAAIEELVDLVRLARE